MATANTVALEVRHPSRWLRNLALLSLVLVALAAVLLWSGMRETATARAADAAQIGCLCRYGSGRSMAACTADPAVVQKWVTLNEDAGADAIVASVPTLAQQTARWSPESGCMLDRWQD